MPQVTEEQAPLRAVDPRDVLAAERTLLAWLRGGMALMGLGFVIARSASFLGGLRPTTAAAEPRPTPAGAALGLALVGAGVVLNVWASLRHRHAVRQLHPGAPAAGLRSPRAIALGAALGGMLLLVLLLALT